ncbi:MAG: amidase [Pseudomonadota bacterium]
MRLSAAAAARLIMAGALTAEGLARALLARIGAREPRVAAWAYLDPDRVLAEARARDREPPRGVLHGVPIGVKDVIDTADMPTACNSPIYAGFVPDRDAICVERLKAAGAIIMGKTVTTEFAFLRPGPTRNPHDPRCTPGGSSSGSGAAVADFMVPAALATQTGGSTIRPAAFCGVVGYKPVHEFWDTRGLKHLAPSLDSIGLIARELADVALVSAVLAGRTPVPVGTTAAPRIALCPTPYADQAEPAARARLDEAARRLEDAGASVRALDLPADFAALNEAHRVIMSAETAKSFAAEWAHHRDELSPELAAFIARGLKHTQSEVAAARAEARRCRAWLDGALAPGETVLTFSTPGEAPEGVEATGNAIFNRMWTLLDAACLTVPAGAGPRGLPLGVQLVDPRGEEGHLFAVARFAMTVALG